MVKGHVTAATAAVFMALTCWSALARDGKGRIVGFVKNEADEPISGAVLILRGEGFVEDARSAKSGVYELEWYPPGTYRVEIRARGFLRQIRKGLKIVRDKDTRLDFVLVRGEQTKGIVVSAGKETLKLKTGDRIASFAIPGRSKIAALEVSQISPGQTVTVTWAMDGDRKYLKDIDARGTVVGKVTKLGDQWVEVTAPGGKPQRFTPCWVGGMPGQGGGFDKDLLRKLGKLRVGMKVTLTWEMPEGRRVVDLKVVD